LPTAGAEPGTIALHFAPTLFETQWPFTGVGSCWLHWASAPATPPFPAYEQFQKKLKFRVSVSSGVVTDAERETGSGASPEEGFAERETEKLPWSPGPPVGFAHVAGGDWRFKHI
jgi:hypothetical protein